MPQPILDAIREARGQSTGTLDDDAWRQRLAERFGSRWRIPRLRTRPSGPLSTTIDESAHASNKKIRARRRQRQDGDAKGKSVGASKTGLSSGDQQAERVKLAGGIPHFRPVGPDDVNEGMIAAWQPHDPEFPEGVVLINIDHMVIRAEIEHWQAQFPDHFAEDIAKEVIEVYGQMAVAKVAHSAHLAGVLPTRLIEQDLRSDSALTMALLGLIGEEAVLAPRLGGKYRSKRRPA